jgi:hypothetical protein
MVSAVFALMLQTETDGALSTGGHRVRARTGAHLACSAVPA